MGSTMREQKKQVPQVAFDSPGGGPEVGEDGRQRSAPPVLPLRAFFQGLRNRPMLQGAAPSAVTLSSWSVSLPLV